jgi:hypothetical protein
MQKHWLPVTITNDSMLGLHIMHQSSTSYILLALQKRELPPWCALAALDVTMESHLEFQVYTPPMSLVSGKTPRTMPIASIARKVDSNSPLRPLHMFHVATAMDPLPSVHDFGCEAVSATGFLPYLAPRKQKNATIWPLPYALATYPGCWSSTPCPVGRRMGTICWFPLPGGSGNNQGY